MVTSDLQRAALKANEFLTLYAPGKPARFATGDVQVLVPERTIGQALAEAQYILNQTSATALQQRLTALDRIRSRQRIINGMHLLTGSGFILLIADKFPEQMKWIGALVSLGAGILGLTLPGSAGSFEKELFDDTSTVSALSGQIAKLQTQLLIDPDLTKGNIASEIADTIGRCSALATKYGLDVIALNSGFYPRPGTEKSVPKDS